MTWTLLGPVGLFKGVRTVSVSREGEMTRLKVTVSLGVPLSRVAARVLPETDQALRDYVPAVRQRAKLLDRKT
jgi:hypothetical protein